MSKPNCYKCKHRRNVPGSAHSSCRHPESPIHNSNPMEELFALLGSSRRRASGIDSSPADGLGVTGVQHGIDNGWFMWPWNFDPTWLQTCNGFESKESDSE